MDFEIVLAALRLLTRLTEASKALMDLLERRRGARDENEKARARPRHLKE